MFVQLVGHFLSFFMIKRFHIKTHTHNFIFILFRSVQSTLISHLNWLKPESVVLQFFQNIESNTMVSTLLFVDYVQLKYIYCISNKFVELVGYLICCIWSEHFHLKSILVILCLHCFDYFDSSLFIITVVWYLIYCVMVIPKHQV